MQDHFRHFQKTNPVSQIFNNKEHSKISPVSGKACLPANDVRLRSEGGVDPRRDQNLKAVFTCDPIAVCWPRARKIERKETSREIRSGRREEGGTWETVFIFVFP